MDHALDTPRLRLRPFVEADREAFAALNDDPAVMRHFPAPLSRAESDAFLDRIEARRREEGLAFLAVEARPDGARPGAAPGDPAGPVVKGPPIGLCGLARVPWEAWFTPAVEIGWRFAPAFQGRGLATEAARACLAHGLGVLGLGRIVAFTAPANERSRRLMLRLGMRRAGAFDHPRLPEGHALRRQVLYEIRG